MDLRLTLGAVLLGFLSCGEPESARFTRDGIPIDTVARVPLGDAVYVRTSPVLALDAASGASGAAIQTTGTVMSDAEARPSFKTGGLLTSVRVSEGDRVRRGQLIATINATELLAGRAQAEAGLEKARRDLARVEALFADSVATRAQRDDAATGVRIAERQLEQISFNAGTTNITSPIEGRVAAKLANPGETVGPGQPVVVIQGTASNDWRVRVALTDAEWARVTEGQASTVRFDAYPGETFAARVTNRASYANASGGTFDVELKLAKQPKALAAGLIARVTIEPKVRSKTDNQVAKPAGFKIPLTALARVAGKRAEVFEVTPEGTVRLLHVELGPFDATTAVVVNGLTGSEQLVTTGATWLRDADRVVVEQ